MAIKYTSQIAMKVPPTEPDHVARLMDIEAENTFTMAPDYANQEPTINYTNLDTDVTWIADRNGYYRFGIYNDGGTPFRAALFINDQAALYLQKDLSDTDSQLVQVEAGDTCHFLVSSGTIRAWWIRFVPPKIIWATTTAAKFNVQLIGQPDYEHMETTNRITALGGTWTADRDGYVWCRLTTGVAGSTVQFFVNGKCTFQALQALAVTIPVSAGDEILINNNDGSPIYAGLINCYFIPPLSVAPMFVTGAELQTGTQPGELAIDPVTKIGSIIGGVPEDFLQSPAPQTADTQLLVAPDVKGAAPTLYPISGLKKIITRPLIFINAINQTVAFDVAAYDTALISRQTSGNVNTTITIANNNAATMGTVIHIAFMPFTSATTWNIIWDTSFKATQGKTLPTLINTTVPLTISFLKASEWWML